MMKKTILSVMMLLAAGVAGAQVENTWTVRPMAGLTVATLSGDDTDDNSSSVAWGVGVEAERRLSERVGLSGGVVYSRDRVKSDGRLFLGSTNDMHYLELDHFRMTFEHIDVPLLFNLHLPYGFALKAGVQPSYRLGFTAKCHYDGFVRDWPTDGQLHETTPEYIATLPKIALSGTKKEDNNPDHNRFNVGIPVGMSYEWKNVQLDVRYLFSLTNEMPDADAKRRCLLLTLGYNFRL